MSMWSELGPLGTGLVIVLYLIKFYFVNQSLEKEEKRSEKRRRETPYKYRDMGPRERKKKKNGSG